MNAHKANLINAATLIIMSGWGYYSSLTPSKTALIPLVFGVVLLALNNGVKFENKAQAHVAVILTLVVLLALIMPLKGAMGRDDSMAMLRIGLMMVTSIVAMVFFIKSFRDARIAREAKK
jgi:CDP-diglyceride synthetase